MCTVKKVIIFPVPSRDVTNQTLSGRELLNYSWPVRVWLVTKRLRAGKTIIFFNSVRCERNPSTWTGKHKKKSKRFHFIGSEVICIYIHLILSLDIKTEVDC
jgi:hypothetical protein